MARFRTHTNPFNYFQRLAPVALNTVLPGFTGTLELEVGFGQGMFIEEYARRHPDRQLLGVEVRKKVVEAVEARVKKSPLSNLYLIQGNGQIVIEDLIPDNSLSRIFVFHPDPWFKKRHHNRRIINAGFLDSVIPKLQMGCRLYISTDVKTLFDEMQTLILARDEWVLSSDEGFWEENYRTNWQLFSEKDHRNSYCGVYVRR